MKESILTSEQREQENALDWIQGIGTGAATGAASGAPLGPWGALVGGIAGGALGAAQTAQRVPSRAPSLSVSLPRLSSPPSAPGSRPTAAGASSLSPQILQQLGQLIPLLTELLARRPAPPPPPPVAARESLGHNEGSFEDLSLEAAEQETEDVRSIEGPIPDEDELLGTAETGESPPSPDYPLAMRFVPAKYYEPRRAPRAIRRIIIHITDGGPNINGTVSWFRNPIKDGKPRKVSAHYIVGRNGEVVQMVPENDVAWHAGSANGDSIGIEHNARAPRPGKPALYPTAAQYCSSAALVRWLCDRYGIPLDRVHILGHAEADPSTMHGGCPNSVWDWDYHMNMVTSASCLPPPSGRPVGEEEESAAETLWEEGVVPEWPLESDSVVVNLASWEEESAEV
jgi:N-acetyl-anhydromuramyl-L-alanine amidase AmpD